MTLQAPIFDIKKFKKIISRLLIITNFNRVLKTYGSFKIRKLHFDYSIFATCIVYQRNPRKFRLWRLITFKRNTLYTSIFYWSYFHYSSNNQKNLNVLPLTVLEEKNRECQNVKTDAGRTFFSPAIGYIDLRSIEGL